jgi:hypothetical protein
MGLNMYQNPMKRPKQQRKLQNYDSPTGTGTYFKRCCAKQDCLISTYVAVTELSSIALLCYQILKTISNNKGAKKV